MLPPAGYLVVSRIGRFLKITMEPMCRLSAILPGGYS